MSQHNRMQVEISKYIIERYEICESKDSNVD